MTIIDEKMVLNECKHCQISHDDENSHEKCQTYNEEIFHDDETSHDETLISTERCQILDEICHQISHEETIIEIEKNDLVCEVILSKLVS
ncbi:hypothetical protein J5751_01855 [bacterium]|nr:hypothetical protein [bacterium]